MRAPAPGCPTLAEPGRPAHALGARGPQIVAKQFLRLRVGAWGPLAKALHDEGDSIQKVASGKRAVTPALALRVARVAGVSMDELLADDCRTAIRRPRQAQWRSTRGKA